MCILSVPEFQLHHKYQTAGSDLCLLHRWLGNQRENHLSRFIERSIYQNIFGGTVDNVEFRSGEGSVTLRCCITSVMVGFSKVESALLNQVGNRCCGEINDLTVCCDLKVDTLSTVLITSRRGNLFDGVFTSLKTAPIWLLRSHL